MRKILVTTDFSANSKAGLRFAIQLASQDKYELTFFHSYEVMRPTGWSDKVYESYEENESAKVKLKLERFVESVYKSSGIAPGNFKCVIKASIVPDANIMYYAAQNGFSYICISRRGGGKFSKLFGSNTYNLITKSEVPVIAVPENYRRSNIESLLYASDLSDLENEVKNVIDFSKPLGARIELLHFKVPSDLQDDSVLKRTILEKFPEYNVSLHLEKLDLAETLVSNLDKVIKKSKPSMMIMYTEPNRGFFDSIFLPSSSAQYSLQSKIPLLVFKRL